MPYAAVHNRERCLQCGMCSQIVACPGEGEVCIGCGACVLACPSTALKLVDEPREGSVTIEVDGRPVSVPERISVKEALGILGYPVAHLPGEQGLYAPCEVGGCWSCTLVVDGTVRPACRTPVAEGMQVRTVVPMDHAPGRLVTSYVQHMHGGVGTPWAVRHQGNTYLEAACFVAGCNFRCPQCQNWPVTYRGRGNPTTPAEAAQKLTKLRESIPVDRLLISGGECTLNRPWLVQLVSELRRLNPDPAARIHVDTNGSLLTHDYIDELVEAGMTDIGIDLKAVESDTFMRITGLGDRQLADMYRDIAWQSVAYTLSKYADRVFVGVGIPYNENLVTTAEIEQAGKRLLVMDPAIQVTLINYRSEFRRRIMIPSDREMENLRQTLKSLGLRTVLAQTIKGHVGP